MCKNILLVSSCLCTSPLFMHLPNWHFLLHLPPLQRPGICAVDNFQRFRFGSLPTSSQERVKQESTFTFTFTLHTIYEVNGTAQYIERCWPDIDNDAILTLYLIHTLYLTLYAFYRASNQLIDPSIDRSIDPSIHQSINPAIHRSIDPSIHRSFDWSINWSIDTLIHWSIHPSIHY